MEIGKFNQMKAYLLKPKRLFTNKQDTIGGGTIQGEDLGSRSGFARRTSTWTEYIEPVAPQRSKGQN